ncbi:MAG: hypothetical protein NC206_03410 [Bacteroides sp.]|nr:hypothetical protein [Roseburia sp.]MCM1346113.1 hypothetical protein [Bacteroides sp.]MCM1421193.1 hypothetical protein [Bacteroides sp.]
MRKILFVAWFIAFSLGSYAQTTLRGTEADAKWKQIISSGDEYVNTTGVGNTEKEAIDEATGALSGLIETTVEHDFENRVSQTTKGANIEAEQQMKSVIKSYSKNTLKNLKALILSDAPKGKVKVAVYIPHSELQKQYEERKQMVRNLVREAVKAQKNSQWDLVFDKLNAAEMYLSMCTEIPNVPAGEGEEQNAKSYISDKKQAIAKKIKVEEKDIIEDGDSNIISILFKYKDENTDAVISNLSYAYEVNGKRSPVYTVNNGEGAVTVPKNFRMIPNQNFHIYVGYSSGDINMINEVDRDVLQVASPLSVSYTINKNLVAKATPQEVDDVETAISTSSEGKFPIVTMTEEEAAPYYETMKQIELIIRNKNYSAAAKLCTPEGFGMFNKLISYGTARLLSVPAVKFLRCGDDITCRSYPMSFSFKSTSRKFTENVVFHLNPEGQITEVAFAMDEKVTDAIMNNKSNNSYDNDVKQIIVNFLERYKTAFALKRKDYIESIFSDEALIIVGSVLKKAENYTDMAKFKGDFEKKVRYTRQKKGEYIENLARCFDSNEYVNIRFTDVTTAAGKPFKGEKNRFYSIQLKQDYFSQTYGDTGFLFLDLDLKDRQHPVINIRVWQPDANGPFVNNGKCSFNDFTWEE